MYGARKSTYWIKRCVSVFNLPMRVCSSINRSVLLEKSPFNITHSRSHIEWSGVLKLLLMLPQASEDDRQKRLGCTWKAEGFVHHMALVVMVSVHQQCRTS